MLIDEVQQACSETQFLKKKKKGRRKEGKAGGRKARKSLKGSVLIHCLC